MPNWFGSKEGGEGQPKDAGEAIQQIRTDLIDFANRLAQVVGRDLSLELRSISHKVADKKAPGYIADAAYNFLSAYQKEYATLQTARHAAYAQAEKLQRENESLSEKIDKNTAIVSGLQQQIQDNINDFNLQMTQSESRHESEIKQLEKTVRNAEARLVSQQQRNQDRKERFAKKLDQVEEQYDKALEDLSKEHSDEFKRLNDLRTQTEARLLGEIELLSDSLAKREQTNVLSDSEVKTAYQQVISGVDRLSRSGWRTEHPRWLDSISRGSDSNPKLLERQLLQDLIWRVLHEEVFTSPFSLLGSDGKDQMTQWQRGFGEGKCGSSPGNTWPQPTMKSERWRSEKLELARRISKEPQPEWDPRHQVKEALSECVKRIQKAIHRQVRDLVEVDDAAKSVITGLAKNSYEFWFSVCCQRYRIEVAIPETVTPALHGPELPQTVQAVELVLIPALLRTGNTKGFHLGGDVVNIVPLKIQRYVGEQMGSGAGYLQQTPYLMDGSDTDVASDEN